MSPDRSDVFYGSLGLMVLKTLEALGPCIVDRCVKIAEDAS